MKQKITVLILEDSLDDFFLLKEVLESSEEVDAKIFHEERLENAISIAKDIVIDVAIIDLSLPDSFGLSTYISFHEEYPSIPFRKALRIIFLRESLLPPPSSEPFVTPSNASA
jgi:DNA-binding NarL/FixJ family response regulator